MSFFTVRVFTEQNFQVLKTCKTCYFSDTGLGSVWLVARLNRLGSTLNVRSSGRLASTFGLSQHGDWLGAPDGLKTRFGLARSSARHTLGFGWLGG